MAFPRFYQGRIEQWKTCFAITEGVDQSHIGTCRGYTINVLLGSNFGVIAIHATYVFGKEKPCHLRLELPVEMEPSERAAIEIRLRIEGQIKANLIEVFSEYEMYEIAREIPWQLVESFSARRREGGCLSKK